MGYSNVQSILKTTYNFAKHIYTCVNAFSIDFQPSIFGHATCSNHKIKYRVSFTYVIQESKGCPIKALVQRYEHISIIARTLPKPCQGSIRDFIAKITTVGCWCHNRDVPIRSKISKRSYMIIATCESM